jgi:hypothetical protein
MKVIADTVLQRAGAGQIIFDPSGEYTYWNEQDQGCLAARHANQCIRYSLRPRTLQIEQDHGLAPPRNLRVNFFEQPDVGHSLIFSLWEAELGHVPDYIVPAQNWEPQPLAQCPDQGQDRSGFNHYWRTMGVWYAILSEAGYQIDQTKSVPIDLPAAVKTQLLADQDIGASIRRAANGDFSTRQPLGLFSAIWKKVDDLRQANQRLFPTSQNTGEPYFNATEIGLLRILNGNIGSGARKFSRFIRYHSLQGSNVFDEITRQAQAGRTVFVDLSMGDERVRKSLADRISRELLTSQMQLFNRNELGERFVILYFEEAHILFPKTDKEVDTDVYNKLSKEGAKFHISMVYATQSMSTLSPDLLKNTENFIVTHLDDDREVKELEHIAIALG